MSAKLRSSIRSGHRLGALAVAFGAALFAGQAFADEASAQRGQQLWADRAGCPFCHGWAADGNGDPHSDGGAPSLRSMALSREQVREVIQCGRPGTGMPYFDRFAYSDGRCFGVTAEDLGDQIPNRASVTLQPAQIDQITDYLVERIQGKGAVTLEECEAYFKGPSSLCDRFPKAGASLPGSDQNKNAAAVTGPETKPGA